MINLNVSKSLKVINKYHEKCRIYTIHDKRLKKYVINFTVIGNKKIIVKSYQNHNGTIVGFIT